LAIIWRKEQICNCVQALAFEWKQEYSKLILLSVKVKVFPLAYAGIEGAELHLQPIRKFSGGRIRSSAPHSGRFTPGKKGTRYT
jgi:hypothetical protein